jgi:DedD protein
VAEALTEQELQLKRRARRRLIGASALALLLVVFLPMLLDREPAPSSHDIAITIPSRDVTPFQPNVAPTESKPALAPGSVAPAPGPAANEQASNAAPATAKSEPAEAGPANPKLAEAEPANAKSAETEPARPKPDKPLDKSSEKVPEKSTRKAADKTRDKVAEKPARTAKLEPVPQRGAFVVQVGVFSDPAKAKQVQTRLAENDVKSYVETTGTARRSKTHVRMGPYATRAEAEKARAELTLLGESSMIIKQ